MKRWLVLISSALLVAGCVKYQPRPLAPGQLETSFRARSLADTNLQAFVQKNLTNAPSHWPPQEVDLPLLTLVAFYFHPDLEAARARIVSAKAGEVLAGERPNPTLAFLPEYVPNPDVGMTPWIYGISWDIPIETAGKRRLRLNEAREVTAAVRLGLAETAWKVRSALRAALVEYFAIEREVQLLREETALQEQRAKLMKIRLDWGEASRFDLGQAQIDLVNAQVALNKANSHLADARLGVAEALGLPGSALASVHLAWERFATLPSETQISAAAVQGVGLLNRLDMRRALEEYLASEASLRSEIAKQYPDVHLTPGYQYDQGQNKISIGPTVTLPILNQNQGGIAQAKGKREEAAAAFSSTQIKAIQETERAYATFHAAMAEWSQANQMVEDLQRRIETATELTVKLGETDRLTLYNAQLQRSAAVRARLDALHHVQSAVGALEDAVQRPISEENVRQVISALAAGLNPANAKGEP